MSLNLYQAQALQRRYRRYPSHLTELHDHNIRPGDGLVSYFRHRVLMENHEA
jgi:hypothetical protein